MKHPILTGLAGGWLASHVAGAKGQRFRYMAGGMLIGLVTKQFQGIDEGPPNLRQDLHIPAPQMTATRFINSSGVSPFAGCSEASWPY